MPDITYGLLHIHPTHHIENPDPAKAWRYEMPEACTLCHTNETAVWAAETQADLFDAQPATALPDDPAFDTAEPIRALLMGDVVQRAVALNALAHERSYAETAESQLWVVPFLLLAMEDNYPAIRFMAWRGLRDVTSRANMALPLYDFDYLADATMRRRDLQTLHTWWQELDKSDVPFPGTAVPLTAQFELDRTLTDPLLARRSNEQINIGE
jgi:hypothetical protein